MNLKVLQNSGVVMVFLVVFDLSIVRAEGTAVTPGKATTSAKMDSNSAVGVVSVSGSAANAQTKISEAGANSEATGVVLCRSAISKRISRVTGMSVMVSGAWSENAVSKEKCMDVKSFKVVKASSGRDVVVGRLVKQDSNFFVVTDDGKRHGLSSVPAGLSKLEGKEVIIDVKPLDSPVSSESAAKSSRVVTYAEHP